MIFGSTAFFFAMRGSFGFGSARVRGAQPGSSTYLKGSVSVFCGTPYLLRSVSTVRMPFISSAPSRARPPFATSSRSYERFASAGVMSRLLATSNASATSRLAGS